MTIIRTFTDMHLYGQAFCFTDRYCYGLFTDTFTDAFTDKSNKRGTAQKLVLPRTPGLGDFSLVVVGFFVCCVPLANNFCVEMMRARLF